MNARHTTLSELFTLFDAMLVDGRRYQPRVRPQDAAADLDAKFEREAGAADRAYQQEREER